MPDQPLTQSYFCGTAEQPLLYRTIGEQFDRTVDAFGDRDALIVRHQDIRWSYNEYRDRVHRLAGGLLALGFGKGDRIGIWATNRYEWCLTQFATAKIGAIMVCINPAYRTFELEYALNKVGCKALITGEVFKTSNYLAMVHELAPELDTCEPGALTAERLPALKTVIRTGDGGTPGMFNFESVCTMGDGCRGRQVRCHRRNPGPG